MVLVVGDGAAAEIAPPKVFRRQWLTGAGPAGGDGDRRRGASHESLNSKSILLLKKSLIFLLLSQKKYDWLHTNTSN